MVHFPRICQVVVCVLYPSSVFYSVNQPSVNYDNTRYSSRSTLGHRSSSLNFRSSNIRTLPTAENILNRLNEMNPIIKSVNITGGYPAGLMIPSSVKLKDNNLQIMLAGGLKIPVRIYGDGSESKLPPFLELIVQRIQSFFSIYKYNDTSRPLAVQEEEQLDINNNDGPNQKIGEPSVIDTSDGINVNDDIDTYPDEDYPTADDWTGLDNDDSESYIVVGETDYNSDMPGYKSVRKTN